MISREDEWLHPAGPDSAWQESFYFNWADPDRRAFTLARIGYRANVRKTDGLVISLRDGELELYYGPADLDHEGPCSNEDPAKGMLAGDFRVTMEEPLSRWRLQIEGEMIEKIGRRAPLTRGSFNRRGRMSRCHSVTERPVYWRWPSSICSINPPRRVMILSSVPSP